MGKDNSPILKCLIQILSTDDFKDDISLQQDFSSTSSTNISINFPKLYKNILDAKDTNKKIAQVLILHYFHFGKVLKN